MRTELLDAATPRPAETGSAMMTIDAVGIVDPIPSVRAPAPDSGQESIAELWSASGRARIAGDQGVGTRVYSDRDFPYTLLPDVLDRGERILTANDDKFTSAEATYLRFVLRRPATVYVAYDERHTGRPSWLAAFRPTRWKLHYRAGSSDSSLLVLERKYPIGRVELGGNQPGGPKQNFGMYAVFVVPDPIEGGSAEPAGGAAMTFEAVETAPSSSSIGAAGVVIPLLMHELDRQRLGLSSSPGIRPGSGSPFGGSLEERAFRDGLLKKYREISPADKRRLFDERILQLTASPQNTVARAEIDRALSRTSVASSLGELQRPDEPPPPAPPSRLVAVNSSGTDMEQQGSGGSSLGIFLQWRWDHGERAPGFAVFRRPVSGTEFAFVGEVPAGTSSFRDAPLPAPGGPRQRFLLSGAGLRATVRDLDARGGRLESEPSNTSCSAYGLQLPPAVDSDQDGMSDPFDWCPNDGLAASVQRVAGCPDLDHDGLPDRVDDPAIPAALRDNCPPGSHADGYGDGAGWRAPEWAALRPIDPLPGCPVRFQLRWMGLEILNDPADCTNPNAPKPGCDKEVGLGNEWQQTNEVIDGRQLPPGFEPYLVFGLLNGISPQGLAQQWTKKWCCGEGVNVGRFPVPDFPPAQVPLSGKEPDADFTGSEDLTVDRQTTEGGWILLPGESAQFVPIDGLGLTLTSTLFERDFDMQYTPAESEANVAKFLQAGLGTVKNIVGCGTSSGGLGCAKALGESVAGLIGLFFGSGGSPDPIVAQDPDDVMGAVSTAFTQESASKATAATGAYAFAQEIPNGTYYVTFPAGLEPKPPLNSKMRVVATMVGRARFCLVRKGLEEARVGQLCRP